MAGSARPFVTRPTLDAEPTPIPISAEFSGSTLILTVTWNVPLQPNPALDIGNWVAFANFTFGIRFFRPSLAVASGNTTVLTMADIGPSSGPNRLDYAPPPFDVLNLSGTPAVPFFGFPLTLIP